MSARAFLRKFLRRSTRFPGYRLREKSRFLNVRMDTTNRCNLRCTMCPMRLSDRDPDRIWHDMDRNLFLSIAAQLFPIARTVAISCGAEPLCNPRFEEYLRILHDCDVPEREMVTNGLLLTRERSAAILSSPPTSIFVSIDGCSESTHGAIRGGCSLGTVLANIRTFAGLRGSRRFPAINFSTTLQRRNLAELDDIARLAARSGASSLCVVPLVPYSGLDVASEAVDISSQDVAAAIAGASSVAAGLGLGFSVSGRAFRSGSDPCPYCSSWVYIDPDGLVNPCPYWDIRSPLGDLKTTAFRDIWGGEGYAGLRKGNSSPTCRLCPEMSGTGQAEIEKSAF
jgi:MoaA/NifB/PqqE/SkfB family radical SAM enzyme